MKKVTLGRIIVSIATVVFLVMLVNVAMAQMPLQNQPVATNGDGIPAYQGASAGDVQAQAEQGAAQVDVLNEALEEGAVVTATAVVVTSIPVTSTTTGTTLPTIPTPLPPPSPPTPPIITPPDDEGEEIEIIPGGVGGADLLEERRREEEARRLMEEMRRIIELMRRIFGI